MIPAWKNTFVAIDVDITSIGEIGRLAAVKLNQSFQPAVGEDPYSVSIIPTQYHNEKLRHLVMTGIMYEDAVRIWRHWRPENIVPVCFNWAKIYQHLTDFGPFIEPARDLMLYIAYMHDRHWWHNYNPGFTSFSRKKVFEVCHVPCVDTHDPLICCHTISQCFSRLFQHPLP